MATEIILAVIGLETVITLIGQVLLMAEIKKGNKDQQEIKTRLTWIKKRQKGER